MKKYFLAGILIITIFLLFIGCTGKANTISGTVFVSGNEPFTYLALKGEDGTFYKLNCDEPIEKELWSKQGQVVSLEYTEVKEIDRESIIMVNKIIKLDK